MNNIGIITYHEANNYGAVLQAFALSNKINAEIIDYRNNCFHEVYKSFKCYGRGIKTTISAIIYYPFRACRNSRFNKFRKNYLNCSRKYDNNNIKEVSNIYEKFITGSDQVWNDTCAGFDEAYFLSFVNDSEKKYSYSASFGFDKIPNNMEDEYFKLLHDFKKISVRENNAIDILRGLGIKNVTQTLDPVFLLSKEEWSKIMPKKNVIKGKYILLYPLAPISDDIEREAQYLSAKYQLPVYNLTDSLRPHKNIKIIKKAVGPLEFLNLFNNASYIITNSFHGTAFSILLNKQFFIDIPKHLKSTSRIINILDLCGLRSRIIDNNKFDKPCIDYGKINDIISIERNKSMNYLNTVLDE